MHPLYKLCFTHLGNLSLVNLEHFTITTSTFANKFPYLSKMNIAVTNFDQV